MSEEKQPEITIDEFVSQLEKKETYIKKHPVKCAETMRLLILGNSYREIREKVKATCGSGIGNKEMKLLKKYLIDQGYILQTLTPKPRERQKKEPSEWSDDTPMDEFKLEGPENVMQFEDQEGDAEDIMISLNPKFSWEDYDEMIATINTMLPFALEMANAVQNYMNVLDRKAKTQKAKDKRDQIRLGAKYLKRIGKLHHQILEMNI